MSSDYTIQIGLVPLQLLRGNITQIGMDVAACYRQCLALAVSQDVKTLSFPSLSTGAYGYPVGKAAKIALRTIAAWVGMHSDVLQTIKLIQHSDIDHQIYRQCAEGLHGSLTTETYG